MNVKIIVSNCLFVCLIKGNGNKKIFLVSFKRLQNHIEVRYRILTLALFRDIFRLEILSCPLRWIFVDIYDMSQVGSRNFIFLRSSD